MRTPTHETLVAVLDRAQALYKRHNITDDRLTVCMDLHYANEDTPIDYGVLLASSVRDFNHDVLGIRHHLNRNTKVLEGCFLPRCALGEPEHDELEDVYGPAMRAGAED